MKFESKWRRIVSAPVLITLLAGCGGEQENKNDEHTPNGDITAYSGFKVITTDSAVIDISQYVNASDLELTNVSTNGEQCSKPTIKGMNIHVTQQAGKFCNYGYRVTDSKGGYANANIAVFSSSAEVPLLPALSHATSVGTSNVEFDINELLNADYPAGYMLDTTSIEVIGQDAFLGTATASGNVITYNPPAQASWNRIIYTLKNQEDATQTKLGTIYVTISDVLNEAPEIAKPKYNYNTETGTAVVARESIELDLETLPNLGISDEDNWQVIAVTSLTADVAIKDPESVTNKTITFIASELGEHELFYTVADMQGGYSSGLIAIFVTPSEIPRSWDDISMPLSNNEYIFSAPERYIDAVDQYVVAAHWDTHVKNTVAAFKKRFPGPVPQVIRQRR